MGNTVLKEKRISSIYEFNKYKCKNLLVSSFFIYKERKERKEKGRKINIVIEKKKKHSNLRRYKSYDFKRLIKLPLKDAKREKETNKKSARLVIYK